MSEKDEKGDAKESIVDTNVALVMAERDEAMDQLAKALDKIKSLEQELANAKALIEEDSKATLVSKIAPRTSVSKAILSKMSVEELAKMDKILDTAMPALRSGAPLPDVRKTSAGAELDSTHARFMAKITGGKAQ